ncbi:uncharacterized protein B0T23DRAFT_394834 [Neurospora hispaniola]|uniref:Uncharacterized protein n=1 Tax=Neurospora hispaniola TaxID=588809 RepID=A0AAJ0IA09_9PEZI|nr:hypothetical protein B0T23DRAFT_394834 [Neurospora hispaniola]
MKLSRFFFCWVSWASLLLACIGPSVSGGTRSNIVDAQCSVYHIHKYKLQRNPEPAFGLPVGEQGIPQVYKVEEMRCDGTKTREQSDYELIPTNPSHSNRSVPAELHADSARYPTLLRARLIIKHLIAPGYLTSEVEDGNPPGYLSKIPPILRGAKSAKNFPFPLFVSSSPQAIWYTLLRFLLVKLQHLEQFCHPVTTEGNRSTEATSYGSTQRSVPYNIVRLSVAWTISQLYPYDDKWNTLAVSIYPTCSQTLTSTLEAQDTLQGTNHMSGLHPKVVQ